MSREVVRRMASSKTHVAEVTRTFPAVQFGSSYRMPDPNTVALCGVKITDGVVMREGTRTLCPACRHLDATGYSGPPS